ncbi:hypothetical protein [Roseiconus lacunae]|uniref:hypothetical protein n=1 Tax=Roseiconus lacunae TaxID=2605694 RepID=UPI0011F21DB9|nr:hypothetical protein [Roseiconus lacunae]
MLQRSLWRSRSDEGSDRCLTEFPAPAVRAIASAGVSKGLTASFARRLTASELVVLALLLGVIGCGGKDRADEDVLAAKNRPQVTLPAIPAADFLEQVISRYRSENAYQDRGYVRMVVTRDGKGSEETAPMSVHLQGAKLDLAAYDARLWSDGSQTFGWIADPNTSLHDQQVVVGGSLHDATSNVRRPSLDRLLRDPILTAKMKAGLGGPPPQLEWLLEADPMANLFRGKQAERIEYVGIRMLRDVPCVVVLAEVDGEQYRFWIDRRRSIMKLVELPTSVAETSVTVGGYEFESLELVLEGATFAPDAASFPSSPKQDFPQRPTYLRALLPLPPRPPHRLLGSKLATFRVRDISDQVDVTQRGVDRSFTLFVMTDPSSASDVTDDMQLISFASLQLANLNDALRAKVRPVVVAGQERARQLRQIGIDRSEWFIVSAPTVLSEFQQYPAVVLVNARGEVLFVAEQQMAGQLTTLPGAISDALSGGDLPAEMRRQWETDRKAYEAKVKELRVVP